MKKIILLRHGDIGRPGTYTGSTDVRLSPLGERQILEKVQPIREMQPQITLCSPMVRCRQSLDLLNLARPPEIDRRLREIDFGRWEGMSYAEIVADYPEEITRWVTEKDEFTFPFGERVSSFRERVIECFQEIRGRKEGVILVVCHGGVIRHMLCALLALPPQSYLSFQIGYAGIATVDLFDEGGVLTSFNL